MRYVTVLFVTLALAACDAGPAARGVDTVTMSSRPPVSEAERASLDSVARILISAAAIDFHDHPPAGDLRFKDVRFGHVTGPGIPVRYMLCGEFLAAEAADPTAWTRFATILTSPYEQWIGPQAAGLCQDSAVIWDPPGDLSDSLQDRFDSLR